MRGTCKGGRQESTNKPSDLPPTACLVAARRASEKRKVLLERYVGKKKLTIRVVCSIRSSNVTSFFLSFFLLHVVFNVYLSKIIKLWYVRGVA